MDPGRKRLESRRPATQAPWSGSALTRTPGLRPPGDRPPWEPKPPPWVVLPDPFTSWAGALSVAGSVRACPHRAQAPGSGVVRGQVQGRDASVPTSSSARLAGCGRGRERPLRFQLAQAPVPPRSANAPSSIRGSDAPGLPWREHRGNSPAATVSPRRTSSPCGGLPDGPLASALRRHPQSRQAPEGSQHLSTTSGP